MGVRQLGSMGRRLAIVLLPLCGLLTYLRWEQSSARNDAIRLQRDMTMAQQLLQAHQERLFREARRLACSGEVRATLQEGQGPALAALLLGEMSAVGAREVQILDLEGHSLGKAGDGPMSPLSTGPLLEAAQRGHDGFGLVPVGRAMVLVSTVAIRNPHQDRPAGVLCVARPIDAELISEVEQITGGRLSVAPYESLVPLTQLAPSQQASRMVAQRVEEWLRQQDPQTVDTTGPVAFQQLHDDHGRPAGLLALTMPPNRSTQISQRVRQAFGALLVVGLLAAATQGLSIRRRHAAGEGAPGALVWPADPPGTSQASPAVDTVSRHLSHHLNNAFAVVVGNLEMMQERLSAPDQRIASEMLGETWRAAGLVQRLQLATNRRTLLHLNPVPLEAALAAAEDRLAASRELPPITVEGLTGLTASGLAGDLVELFVALLENAAEAAGPGGQIRLEAHQTGAWLRLGITDDGPGLSAETIARAPELFFTTRGPRRLGLGLSVVDGVLARHGGRWQIVSSPGQGCRVDCELPAWEPAASAGD